MNCFLKKIIVGCLFICCVATSSQAVSEKEATYGPIVGGIAMGAVSGALTYYREKNPLMAVLVGLGLGGFFGTVLDRYLAKLTPTVRLNTAHKIARLMQMDDLLFCDITAIPAPRLGQSYEQCEKLLRDGEEVLRLLEFVVKDCKDRGMITRCDMLRSATCELIKTIKSKLVLITSCLEDVDLRSRAQNLSHVFNTIKSDPFLAYAFTTVEDFINYINLRFGTSWPLVLARDHVMGLTKAIEGLVPSVDNVLSRALVKDLPDVVNTCNELRAKVQPLTQELLNKINLILTHENYNFQVGLYENAQCLERQRLYAEELARKQRAHEEYLARQQREHAENLALQQRRHAERLAEEQRKAEEKQQKKKLVLAEQAIALGSKVTIKV